MKQRSQPRDAILPTPAELDILLILWRLGEGSVDQIVRAAATPPPNYKTTQAILRIMEAKNLVAHRMRGRAFAFFPKVAREQVNRGTLRSLLRRNFAGSRTELLIHLFDDEPPSADEMASLEELLRRQKAQPARGGRPK